MKIEMEFSQQAWTTIAKCLKAVDYWNAGNLTDYDYLIVDSMVEKIEEELSCANPETHC